MLYLNKDTGSAVSEIISTVTAIHNIAQIEIRLTQDELVTTLVPNRSNKPNQTKTAGAVKSAETTISTNRKHKKSRGKSSGKERFTYNGISLTVSEWAERLNMSTNGMLYRLRKHGNPYGLKGPTDTDKIIAGI